MNDPHDDVNADWILTPEDEKNAKPLPTAAAFVVIGALVTAWIAVVVVVLIALP